MREYGGYFGLELISGEEYHQGMMDFNCGRNAIRYLVRKKRISKVYLPYYICESVIEAFQGCKIQYYHVGMDLMPNEEVRVKDSEYFYLVNYFGRLTDEEIALYKKKYNRIIVDYAQAFFQKPIEGICALYTCRKFFGVPDGAYMYIEQYKYDENADDIIKERQIVTGTIDYLLGRIEDNAQDFYSGYREHEIGISTWPIKRMSIFSNNILRGISYMDIANKRKENYNILNSILQKYNMLEYKEVEGPYAYPLYCRAGEQIREKLWKKNIYIPVLWDSVNMGVVESDFVANLLAIPCDQRYGKKEMLYISNCIEQLLMEETDEKK